MCAYTAAQEIAQVNNATIMSYIPHEVKARIADEAIRRNIPVEYALRKFVE